MGQPAEAGEGSTQIKVMTLNVFYGGDEIDLATGDFCAEPDACTETLAQVGRVIQSAGADIVGIQEPERNTSRIARTLGWYASDRAHVMSRFPIIDPPGSNGLYVFVEISPGRVVAVANTHLPSDPYGPYLVRDGGSRADVVELERDTRLAAARDAVAPLPGLAAKGIPVFLTGDFNSPSHLDWTPAVAKARDDVPFAVDWPASRALADAGLTDTYREAHPDPVKDPGFTWTPGGPEADPQEVHDRIDWVLRAARTDRRQPCRR
ncbi:endonuclease/exonuclease/phosphatase family protein [Asanoa siamensis]|uniref:endonuclease/exonuclease/phosphatase family protein n=1 Tax=Asanoa siamensis TaxID=926357 RepID=UPI00194125EF|nr:endonuclease/exonuclease/phosphatase family protein [Asanoa siamensis]